MVDGLIGEKLDAELMVNAPNGDPLFIGDGQTWYHVMLPRDQFELAEHYLRSRAKENLVVIEPDHPLCGFDDRELMDVLVRPDEWSADDSEVAKRLLSERGKPVSEEAVELLREARLDDIRQTAPSQTAFLVLGLISALAGGFLGMAIGWYINTAKKTLPNGEQVYTYRKEDRKRAVMIFGLGAGVFATLLITRFLVAVFR